MSLRLIVRCNSCIISKNRAHSYLCLICVRRQFIECFLWTPRLINVYYRFPYSFRTNKTRLTVDCMYFIFIHIKQCTIMFADCIIRRFGTAEEHLSVIRNCWICRHCSWKRLERYPVKIWMYIINYLVSFSFFPQTIF